MVELDFQIHALLDAYAQGSVDPEAVIEMVYDRIEACSDKAIWISLLPRADALAAARALAEKDVTTERFAALWCSLRGER